MSGKIERKIKIVTQQQILQDIPASEGYPMRKWSIKLVALGSEGQEQPALFIEKVTYKLHPSFEKPIRHFKKPPFKLEQEGWGEFDMQITLQFAEKGGTKELTHDLHFQAPKYEITHVLDFPKPSPGLLKLLNESKETSVPTPVSAPAPSQPSPATVSDDTKKRKLETSEDNRPVKKTTAGKGREWTGKPSDMDRLAQGLQKLHEDDLLQVVRIVSDHRTPEMYVKNDLEEGEFSMDLYTLGDPLLRRLWDFTRQRVEV